MKRNFTKIFKSGSDGTNYWPLILLSIGVIGLYALSWWWLSCSFHDSEKQGQFGDQFGAVNALFSGLAFAGLIFTIILQKKELALQREELTQTREELKGQKEQMSEQNDTLKIQRFENLFYNMLNLQQKIVDGLRYDYYDEEYVTVALDGGGATTDKKKVKREVVGRDVFRYMFEKIDLSSLTPQVIGYKLYLRVFGMKEYDETLVPTYFDHYFLHLYKIMQFVDSYDLDYNVSYEYMSLLRGTLSRYELVWIYYNTLNPQFNASKQLIEKYSLLKHLRSYLLSFTLEHSQYCENRGITSDDVKNNHFDLNDFPFYLTDNVKETDKYYLSAFWEKTEIDKGKDYLQRWRAFIDLKTESEVKPASY